MNAAHDSPFIIVVDSLKSCPEAFKSLPLIEASSYLSGDFPVNRTKKVYNLCTHRRRLSIGYYVSLLAEARNQRALPEAKTLHQLERTALARDAIEDLQETIDHSFKRITGDHFVLSVYFGENLAKTHSALAKKLYAHFPSPLVRYDFRRHQRWKLVSVHHMGLNEIPNEHQAFVLTQTETVIGQRWRSTRPSSRHFAYDLAILVNPEERLAPSDESALRKFCKAAERQSIRAEIIHPRDFPRLLEFDALFIRETTRLDNHTFRFALKAQQAGLAVIDDPESIRRCCNKVFLNELMKRSKVPTPQATLILRSNYEQIAKTFSYPIILKIPDGSFSIGVYKVKSESELLDLAKELFTTSSILLAQEFLPTDYDWRIGIIDGHPLYACRYYMSKGHWQIYNHQKKGDDFSGESDCVAIDQVPPVVIETALRATSLIGNSLYGVDLKHIGDQALIIEVNDNPSIDGGIEDALIGDTLYDMIISTLRRHILALRSGNENTVASVKRAPHA